MYIDTVIQPEVVNVICNGEVSVVTYINDNKCTGIVQSKNDELELFRLDVNRGTTNQMSLALTTILKTVYSHVNSGLWDGGPIEIHLDTETTVTDALEHDGVTIIKDEL